MRYSKLTVVVVLVLATFLASATAQPKYVLRLSSPVSKDHAFGRGAEKFKQLVADSTRGQVDVQVHHANALSPIREGLEMVRRGAREPLRAGDEYAHPAVLLEGHRHDVHGAGRPHGPDPRAAPPRQGVQ